MTTYDQIIYEIARSEGFSDVVAKLITAQARLESTDYTSSVFKCNNNMYGMKYVGQSLAKRGTLAPSNEISKGCTPTGSGCDRNGIGCKDSDYYAKYNTPEDSARDAIQRLYKKTINGVTSEELNLSTDSTSFATNLKKRGYYGFSRYGESGAQKEIDQYAAMLRSKLKKVSVTEWVADIYKKNKTAINLTVVGGVLIGLSAYLYILYKKKIILKK